ncbi:chorismate mutase [Methylorubrum zatmanii]|uniref:chorismate mutase n=1 Tax=Methylorubrum zatmanii TaxID=29429 RepID=A0ABW1WPL9_9HYPH|nr:chorismate mutase [Methylorubrum zatmanii]MBD8906357.1 hypothetical protein [Methylorubrum zatmanii]
MRFTTRPAPSLDNLAELRAEIDRIDAEMHALLIQRGAIIDRLIAVKRTQGSGSAFRPGREASMMRRIAERHRGLLPLDTVEGIWRVIIATFTWVQAPFSVHADISAGDAGMRDSARFHFGFTVPYRPHPNCAAVIEAVAGSRGDLGIFRLGKDGAGAPRPWWESLVGEGRPKVIARLPFIERPAHPAGTPVFVVANPLDDPAAAQRDWVLYAVRAPGFAPESERALHDLYGEVVARSEAAEGVSLLLAVPGGVGPRQLGEALARVEAGATILDEVGSHAARFRV